MDLSTYFKNAVKNFKKECHENIEHIGEEAVEIAKQSTAYNDVTGNLRASNSYYVDDDCNLRLYNSADYASNVEMRTGNVLADAVLYAINKLNAQ